MNIEQMDIEFQVALQGTASNVRKGFQPEERMLYLNNAMYEWINLLVAKTRDPRSVGYAGNYSALEGLEELITPGDLLLFQNDASSDFTPLPANFLTALDVNAKTGCDTAKVTYQTGNVRYTTIPLPTVSVDTWTIAVTTSVGITQVFDYLDYFTAGRDASLNYEVIDVILQNVTYPNLMVYWERYGDIYVKNNFIFVIASTDAETLTSTTSMLNAASTIRIATVLNTPYATTTEAVSLVPCRTVDASVIRKQANPFTSTRHDDPMVSFTTGKVMLYHFGSFAASGIQLVYVRKPRTLSLALSQSCELGSASATKERICRAIIDIAIRNVVADTKSPDYQVRVNETVLSN